MSKMILEFLALVRDYISKVYSETDGPDRQNQGVVTRTILMLQFVHDLKSQDVGTSNIDISGAAALLLGLKLYYLQDCPRYDSGW